MILVDFCGHCGVLLPEGKGWDEDPRCDNCDNSVVETKDRIQGEFKGSEATRLHKVYFEGE